MIELTTTWQQTVQALEHEDFDAAYWILDGAFREASRAQRAQVTLLIATLHSLYGDHGSDDARSSLREAVTLDPKLKDDALYQALAAELTAREAPERAPELARRALRGAARLPLPDEPAIARYHVMAALALADQPQEALEHAPTAQELPPHLRWRLRSWQADSEEQLGHHEDAANLYAEAAFLASGVNRAVMLQERAAVLLQMERHEDALGVLEQARAGYGADEDDLNLANWQYLNAQALLGVGRHDDALAAILDAEKREALAEDPSYGVALVHGQVLMASGRAADAGAQFQRALQLARPEDRPYALHELGVAYLDQDSAVEARECLQQTLAFEEYPFMPEVYADLAEAEYRLGRLPEAEASAQMALQQGATIPASMVLGSIALDYYHLDDAVEHYERVVREAAHGTRDWVTGHQMLADILSQQGFRDAAAIYTHATLALEHTERDDEWHATLSELAQRAEQELKGSRRTLN